MDTLRTITPYLLGYLASSVCVALFVGRAIAKTNPLEEAMPVHIPRSSDSVGGAHDAEDEAMIA